MPKVIMGSIVGKMHAGRRGQTLSGKGERCPFFHELMPQRRALADPLLLADPVLQAVLSLP